ncbi:hypothetical protein BDB00DRAFT_834981 [Zychaea mexicana]|uniref:uncharacterized protein n=1 Tax=Zychaea mexicana TaxID=64656 RepID=UPI0022FDEF6A|nr:uncharacterized protein BDB00DRAFT_834981 [Zychaea mexicana]KAI9491048.1 hypothetical protein BDB00DRAFT_834981 [Zychaea mexicana]
MRLIYTILLIFLIIGTFIAPRHHTTSAAPVEVDVVFDKRGVQDFHNTTPTPTSSSSCHQRDNNDNKKRDLLAARANTDDDNNDNNSDDDCPTETTTATETATETSSSEDYSDAPEAIYGEDWVTPQMGVAGAVLIVLGLYLMVFGFRCFRPTLAVAGFLTFGLITWVGMTNSQSANGFTNDAITMLAVPAGLGVLGAILYSFLWNVSIYLVGGMGGLAFGLFILCWREDLVITQNVPRACFLVAISLFFAAITFFGERYVVLFATSFTGAYIFIVGIDFLTHTGYIAGVKSVLDQNPLHRVKYTIDRKVYGMMAVIIVLFLISFGWQFFYNRGRDFGVNVEPVKKGADGGESGGPAGGSEPSGGGGGNDAGSGGGEKTEG